MHLAYAACAHAKKKNFVKFIELIRSISNPFEFCKSDENWAQLLALKLYAFEAIRNLMLLLAYLFFFSLLASENIKNIKLRIASNAYNFKASNWAQFSSDLQNSNGFEMLRISSINSTKFFFLACAHAAYARCIYIYLLATDQIKSFLYSLCVGFNRFRIDWDRTEPKFQWFGFLSFDPVRFQTERRN
jgi:hypothetical protein